MNRYSFLFSMFAALVLVTGCNPTVTSSVEARSPYSSKTATANAGSWNNNRTAEVDTKTGYLECKKEMEETYLSTNPPRSTEENDRQVRIRQGIHRHCLCLSQSEGKEARSCPDVLPDGYGMGFGYGPVSVPGGGVVVPGAFAGFPGAAPVVIPNPGAVGGATSGGGTLVVPPSGGAGTAKLERKVDLLHKAVVEQQKCLDAVKSGKDCPPASK